MQEFHADTASPASSPETAAAHTLQASAVAEYLHQHPDFFIAHESLLSELVLPHHTGDHAVSLVERQVSVLRDRNRDARHRLNRLLDTARDNDRLFQKTQKLVLAILDQTQQEGIVDTVEACLRDDYQVDTCHLQLFDSTTLAAARAEIGALLNTRQPTCGHLRPAEIEFLFSQATQTVRSAAVVPILPPDATAATDPLGILAIGSFDPDYFHSGMGTLFLSYLADILARTLPRCPTARS